MHHLPLLIASLSFGPALLAQDVQIQAQVARTWFLDLDHGALGAPEHREIPNAATLAAGTSRWLTATSGVCLGTGAVTVRYDAAGNAELQAFFDCHLHTLGSGSAGNASSGGELVVTLQAPTARRGTLQIGIDTTGSFGAATAGDMLVDIGDDGVGDYGHSTAAPRLALREFPCTATPGGTPIRITHQASATGDNSGDARYVIVLRMLFLADTSPFVPYLPGPEPLLFMRLPNGGGMIGFSAPSTPGALLFLCVGEPLVPAARQVHVGAPWMTGTIHTTFLATRMLATPTWVFPPTLLPPGRQACVQGFVFRSGNLAATDSYLVN